MIYLIILQRQIGDKRHALQHGVLLYISMLFHNFKISAQDFIPLIQGFFPLWPYSRPLWKKWNPQHRNTLSKSLHITIYFLICKSLHRNLFQWYCIFYHCGFKKGVFGSSRYKPWNFHGNPIIHLLLTFSFIKTLLPRYYFA